MSTDLTHCLRFLLTGLLAAALLLGTLPVRAGQVSLEDLRAFADAWGYIKAHHVDDIDDRKLLEAAIRGMLSELDPHSNWLSPDEFRNVEEQASGRYGGLGIRISVQEDHLRVIDAMRDSPAKRAGLMPGDRIVAIDDRALTSENTGQATTWLRGTPGTDVDLIVERDGEKDSLRFALRREIIHRNSATLETLPGGYAVIRLRQFQQNTATELDDILAELEREEARPAGLVLDLRDNPGGMLHAAVAVADRFLSDKLVVYTESRNAEENLSLSSHAGENLAGVPMVVLVNQASASASEIVAGALQDHARAMILGEPTFGKGSVQTVWPLRNGGGIRLTTARYFTPLGRSIEEFGIEPDVRANPARHADLPDGQDPLVEEALALFRSAERLYRGSGQIE
ncbi:MAG: S41 family peptidase [Wenzhouxiangella sp.]|nr:MAG: S41 family peptidase [Wenzhouxiangella sp.]